MSDSLTALWEFSLNISLQNSSSTLTDDQIEALGRANAAASYLSIVGALFNLIITLLFKSANELMNNMVIALSIMDLVNSSVFPFSDLPVTGDWVCQLESFIIYFGYAGSIVLTCCFAHSLYTTINHPEGLLSENIFKTYLLSSIICGSIVATSSVVTQLRVLIPSTSTCGHILNPNIFDLGSLLVLVIPSTVSLLYCSYCYFKVLKKLREMSKKIFVVLLFYPLILVVTNLPTTVIRIINLADPKFQTPFTWSLVANVLIGSRGFLNALAYGLSRRLVEEYKKKCCKKRNLRNSTHSVLEEREIGSIQRASTLTEAVLGGKTIENSATKLY